MFKIFTISILCVAFFLWIFWLFFIPRTKTQQKQEAIIESGEEIVSGWNYFEIRKLFNFMMSLSNMGISPIFKYDELNKRVVVRICIYRKSQYEIDIINNMFRRLELNNKAELQYIYKRGDIENEN